MLYATKNMEIYYLFPFYLLFLEIEHQDHPVHDTSDCSEENEVGGADFKSPSWQVRRDKERVRGCVGVSRNLLEVHPPPVSLSGLLRSLSPTRKC